jgi:hypothetical protein
MTSFSIFSDRIASFSMNILRNSKVEHNMLGEATENQLRTIYPKS